MSEIVIDTNVFEHLLNSDVNVDFHIDRLLNYLARNRYTLLVDSTQKIAKEYEARLKPIIRNVDDTGDRRYILAYWMIFSTRREEELDLADQLMRGIKRVIFEPKEHADRAFVYVSCRGNCYLITNDGIHILGRRDQLLKRTHGLRGANTDFIRSGDACSVFNLWGKP